MQHKQTPLHMAAMMGDSESVQLLLAADSNPNVEDIVSILPSTNITKLCGAELCVVDLCSTSTPR